MILFKVRPAFRLLAEDMVWCPEWQLMTYWGFNPDVNPAYDYAETGLCHGEYPEQKWERSGFNNFDSVHKAELWHTYGFEWSADKARSGAVLIGYCDYLGTRPKNSHRPIIVTGR